MSKGLDTMALFGENSDDLICGSPIDFETELFPNFEERDWSVGDTACLASGIKSPTLQGSCERRCEDALSYDSDGSGSTVDVGDTEHVLDTSKAREADDELVTYLTGIKDTRVQSKCNGVNIVRILQKGEPRKGNEGESRVLKIDSSGNQRMLATVKVVNQTPHIMKINCNKDSSSVPDTKWLQNQRCLSKSAVAARENRERKKRYVAELENTVKELSLNNETLKEQNKSFTNAVEKLKQEVTYLKSVLANQSTLSKLLQNIPGIPDISVSSSEYTCVEATKRKIAQESTDVRCSSEQKGDNIPRKRSKIDKSDHSYTEKFSHSVSGSKVHLKAEDAAETAGVCLHVSGSAVSLEFCASCSQKAKTTKL